MSPPSPPYPDPAKDGHDTLRPRRNIYIYVYTFRVFVRHWDARWGASGGGGAACIRAWGRAAVRAGRGGGTASVKPWPWSQIPKKALTRARANCRYPIPSLGSDTNAHATNCLTATIVAVCCFVVWVFSSIGRMLAVSVCPCRCFLRYLTQLPRLDTCSLCFVRYFLSI